MGPVGGDPGDRQIPRREDRRAHGARGMHSVDVDRVDVVALTRALSDIDSTTGREAETGRMLASVLRERGYDVAEQPVAGDRFNVFATLGEPPEVVFSTHYDCVPPFFPTRVEGGMLFGRGVCD